MGEACRRPRREHLRHACAWVPHMPGILAPGASRSNVIVEAVAEHTLGNGACGAMVSVSPREARSPAGSVIQVAQFLGVCRNAFEQIGLILQAALDPAVAPRARRGEFVTYLDHFDPRDACLQKCRCKNNNAPLHPPVAEATGKARWGGTKSQRSAGGNAASPGSSSSPCQYTAIHPVVQSG